MGLSALESLRRKLAGVRLRPFDTTTADGRAKERGRRIALSALASMVAKLVSVATALVTVPLTLGYLGPDRYGVWMSMTSVIAILAFADLGIGNGIMNGVATAFGRQDDREIRRTIASGFAMLAAVAAIGVSAFALAYPHIDWMQVFNIRSEGAIDGVGSGMVAFVIIFALNIPMGIVQRAQLALQEGFQNSLWQCAGSVVGLASVLVVVRAEGDLVWLVVAYAGVPLFAQIVSGLSLLRRRPSVIPSLGDVSYTRALELGRAGAAFFFLQLGASIAFATDNLVIAHQLSVRDVTDYSVYQKLFSMIPMVLGMALVPLWPAYAEALARRDVKWIGTTLRRVTVGSFLVAGASSAILILTSPWIVAWWVGPHVENVPLLTWGLSLWVIVDCSGKSIAMFLNGMNVLWTQLWIVFTFVPMCFALKYWLAGEIGSAGVPIGVAIAYVVVHVPAYAWLVSRWVRQNRMDVRNDGGST